MQCFKTQDINEVYTVLCELSSVSSVLLKTAASVMKTPKKHPLLTASLAAWMKVHIKVRVQFLIEEATCEYCS